MYKRPITYEDFNGNEVTETFNFHLSKAELVELEVSYDQGFADTLQRIIETQDTKGLVAEFKKLILLAYGVRSEDGKRFIKSDQLREEFTQHPAYSALFMELATDDKAAGDFVNGIIPRDMAELVAQQDKPLAPPPGAPLNFPVPPGV
jgi:hypothetical protein